MNPPTLIGGSTPPSGGAVPSAVSGVLDAYSATVFANADALFDDLFCLCESAGFEPVRADGPKVRFYARNQLLLDAKGHRLLSVKSGGANPHPHVECTGMASNALAAFLRASYRHKPTRIDHAVDRSGDGLFDQIRAYSQALARDNRLKWAPSGDWVTPDAGRTIYLGSRSSQVFVRIYEKGLKYAHDMGLPVTPELRAWVRIELEFKPQNDTAKAVASKIAGPDLWGTTLWTGQLSREVLSMPAQPVSIRERRESNRERALRFMASQYGSHLRDLLEECGGDLSQFGHAIADLAGLLGDEAEQAA